MENLSLYKILTESERDMYEGFIESQLDEEYPEGFDINEFKILKSYSAKMKYAKAYLGNPIGDGSSRVVYRVDETKVLKLAKNVKGVGQNNAETDWYNDSYFSNILANVIDFDEDNHYWVEMELAKKVNKTDFKKLWGINFNDIYRYLYNKYAENNPYKTLMTFGMDNKIKEQLDESEEINSLVDFMFQTDSPPGDLIKPNSWGKVVRDGYEFLVLIDFGLTSEVYNSYYN